MKTFEQDFIQLVENYLSHEQLTFENIDNCLEICKKFKKKLSLENLIRKIRFTIDLYTKNYDVSQITITEYDKYNIKDEFGQINYIETIKLHFSQNTFFIKYTIEDSSKKTMKYFPKNLSPSIKNNDLIYHEFFIDDILIIKKEQNDKKPDFINLTCLKEIIEMENIPDINPIKFLEILLNLFKTEYYFDSVLQKIENENDSNKYYLKKTYDSDSDMSIEE